MRRRVWVGVTAGAILATGGLMLITEAFWLRFATAAVGPWLAAAGAVVVSLSAAAFAAAISGSRAAGGVKAPGASRAAPPRPRALNPRCQHYAFAHLALRELIFGDPVRWMGVLYGPEAEKFLAELWRAVTRQCRAAGQLATLSDEGMRIYQLGLEPCPIIAIQMPPARAATEAHFVGLVLLPPDEDGQPGAGPGDDDPEERKPRLLYYTLEKAARSGAEGRTALCAWTPEGAHVHRGEGPPADLESFAMVLRRLARMRTGGGADTTS